MPGLLEEVRPVHPVTGLGTIVADRLSRCQSGRWAAQFTPAPRMPAREEEAAGAARATRAKQSLDKQAVRAELRELGYLNERGLLEDDQFEMHKRRLLGAEPAAGESQRPKKSRRLWHIRGG